jgi:Type I phosphodiesterase / nucleotide pyrophosphatase
MGPRTRLVRTIVAGAAAAGLIAAITVPASADDRSRGRNGRHVLLISVDGMHQSDLSWYVANHPDSTLAHLAGSGTDYSNASTPFPSDSFPGMVAQVTGGNPSSTGVYYDDTWNHALISQANLPKSYDPTHPYPALCKGVAPGVEVTYFEQLDKNLNSIDAGQGQSGLPGSILNMTSQPRDVIDPTQLPVDPATCAPVYPHQYLKVNTIFNVARQNGLTTAWSDKHPAYEILDGPSGNGVQDFFTPEINSATDGVPGHPDWTTDNVLTQQYDTYKVQAVLNWIDGKDHSGTDTRGTPNIFGTNFQTVSTGQKLTTSHVASNPTGQPQPGGYLADGTTPGPVLAGALDFVDASLAKMVAELHKRHLDDSTTIVISAKHGQSPQNPAALTRIDDGPIIGAINTAWAVSHPSNPKLVVFAVDDDGMLMWTSDRSPAATSFVSAWLMSHPATGNGIDPTIPKTVPASGLTQAYAGAAAADLIGVAPSDPRVPDVIGIAQYGTVYTGGTKKIAEHGGDNPQDRNVPILISGPSARQGRMNTAPVETTQIAPTILDLLGLNPHQLQAVQQEGTQVLPGL